MNSAVRRSAAGAFVVASILLPVIFPVLIHSQTQESSRRKLLAHAIPPYPDLARTMALEGVVKVDALVAPDGSVKDVSVVGGHPVLAQAAAKAVRQWRWEPSTHESHEMVQVKFTPPE